MPWIVTVQYVMFVPPPPVLLALAPQALDLADVGRLNILQNNGADAVDGETWMK